MCLLMRWIVYENQEYLIITNVDIILPISTKYFCLLRGGGSCVASVLRFQFIIQFIISFVLLAGGKNVHWADVQCALMFCRLSVPPQWLTTLRGRSPAPAGSCGPKSAPVCRRWERKQWWTTTRSSATPSSQHNHLIIMAISMGQMPVPPAPSGSQWRILRST